MWNTKRRSLLNYWTTHLFSNTDLSRLNSFILTSMTWTWIIRPQLDRILIVPTYKSDKKRVWVIPYETISLWELQYGTWKNRGIENLLVSHGNIFWLLQNIAKNLKTIIITGKTTIYDIPIFNTQFKILKSSHTNCFADTESFEDSPH